MSGSSNESASGVEEETLARRLRSHAKKTEPVPKMTLRFTSGTKKKRALKESSVEEAGPTMANKMSTAARGRIRGSAGKNSFLKAAKEHLTEGLESESGDSDPPYRSSYRPASPTKTRTLPSREPHGADEELRKLRADNTRLARELELVRAELCAFKEAYSESQKRTNANLRFSLMEVVVRE